MSTVRHCQGCGRVEGKPYVSWHNRRHPNGTWYRVEKGGPIVVLRPLDLGGLGERLYCQKCWHLGLLENGRLQAPQLGRGKKKAARRPDPCQIRML